MDDPPKPNNPSGPIDSRYAGTKAQFLEDLVRFGPIPSTIVEVNGRSVTLDAAIKLIDRLPDDVYLFRRGRHITIQPDPFETPPLEPVPDPRSRDLVNRFLERQPETDRLDAEERLQQRWWPRLRRWLRRRN